jgi:hypothetical protein
MTAEVTVMNRQAIALAADSAVTVTTGQGSSKAWPSVTKIFGLPDPHSVGLMMYGSMGLHRVPWETIIKQFSRTLPATTYPRLQDYNTAFLRYLRSQKALRPSDEQELYVYTKLVMEYLDLRKDIDDAIESALAQASGGTLRPADQRTIIAGIIDAWGKELRGRPRLTRLPRDFRARFSRTYGKYVREAKKGVFQQLPLTQAQSRRLTTIGYLMFERVWLWDSHSGIVVAGYGRDDLFPSVRPLQIEGFVLDYLVLNRGDPIEVKSG